MLLALITALPILGVVLPLATARFHRNICTIATAVPPLISLGLLVYSHEAVVGLNTPRFEMPWISTLGLNFSLRLDGLSHVFAAMVLLIGLLVILYARYYLSDKEPVGRFYAYLLLFMGAMLGVVLSSNLILLVVFWELTSLSSFLLIGFWHQDSGARKGARMALTVTGAGGLGLLAGVLLLGQIVGSFEMDVLFENVELVQQSALYPVVLMLVLFGAFTKSAQFPFHFWLPHAMAAPTPVSAYLHSATMVKAGVFLLARMYPVLAGTDWWFYTVSLAGLATLLLGAVMAMFQNDLKGLLAYSTISHLGLITLLFGLNTPESNVAAIFHIMNHATFKASLFMAAGIIDHETGTRDVRKLGGLRKYMPHTFLLATVASAAMAGVPLLNGFLSKEMFFVETLQQNVFGPYSWLIPMVATLASVFSVGYSLRLVIEVFLGEESKATPIYPPHDAPRYMRAPMEVLVIVCIILGVVPAFVIGEALTAASFASLGGPVPEYSLALWHGFNLPLGMSILALVGGVLVFRYRAELFGWGKRIEHWDAKLNFEMFMQRWVRLAEGVTGFMERRSFQWYVTVVLTTMSVMCIVAFFQFESLVGTRGLTPLDPVTALGMVVLCVSSVLTARFHKSRLRALLTMGIAGTMVAMAFARFSAPDLALTQFSVEVATLILLMLALYYVPSYSPKETPFRLRVRRVIIAGVTGVVVALLNFIVLTRHYDTTIADFYIANSVEGGGGTNIVNVILVDFRGYDTMGEITVLGIAALAIYAMLKNLQLFQPTCDPQGRNWARARHPLVLETLSRVSLPFALTVAAFIFMRGHNLPGGGFIAGLITACALILQYIASGTDWVEARMKIPFEIVIGVGVALAGVTGLVSVFFGAPFLTSAFDHIHIPLIGDVEIASAVAFDLGVYLAVVGATMLILTSLGKLGLLGQREDHS